MNSHKFRVAIFSPGLNIGGIEKVFLNYASLLSANGYAVTFLTCHENTDLIDLVPDRVKLVNLRTNKLSKSIFSIANFLRIENPDFIFTANAATIAIFLAKLLSCSKVKIIASHHNYLNQEVKKYRDKVLLFRIYNFCFRVIAVSQGIYEHLIERKVNPYLIRIITNPINLEEIDKLSKELLPVSFHGQYILFVGRLSVVKNILFLIHSYSLLLKERNDVKLVIVGDGPEQHSIEREIENLKLHDNVILTGVMANPYPFIRNAALVVLPSFSEAFPTVLLESLYLGKTIVATPTKGALDILKDGKLGYLSKTFDDIQEFSNLILKGLNIPFPSSYLQNRFSELYSPSISLMKVVDMLKGK